MEMVISAGTDLHLIVEKIYGTIYGKDYPYA